MTETPQTRSGLDRLIEYGALLAVLVSPTQVGIPLLKLGRATVALTAADIVLWLLAALLVARWLASGRRARLAWPPVHVWLLVAVAGLSASAWLSPGLAKDQVLATAKEVFQFVGTFVAAPLVFLSAFTEERSRRRAVWLVVAVAVPVCLLGLAQALAEQAGLAGREALFVTRVQELKPRPNDPGNVVGLFGSRTVYGLFLVMVLPVVLTLAWVSRPKAGIPLLLLFTVGAATVCAPGILPGLVVAVLVAAAALGVGERAALRALGLAAALLALAIGLGPFRAEKSDLSILYERPVKPAAASVAPAEAADPVETRLTVDNRYTEWGSTMQMVGTNQWPVAAIGYGPGHYQDQIGGYAGPLPKFGKLEPDFQGQYFVVLVELGLAGLAALAWFFGRTATLSWRVLRAAREPFDRALAAGALGGFCGLSVANLYGCPLVKGLCVTLMLLASLIVTSANTVHRED